jgi:hypothetical protein
MDPSGPIPYLESIPTVTGDFGSGVKAGRAWHAGCNSKQPEGGTSKEPAGLTSISPWVSRQLEHRPRGTRCNPQKAGKAGAQIFGRGSHPSRVRPFVYSARNLVLVTASDIALELAGGRRNLWPSSHTVFVPPLRHAPVEADTSPPAPCAATAWPGTAPAPPLARRLRFFIRRLRRLHPSEPIARRWVRDTHLGICPRVRGGACRCGL